MTNYYFNVVYIGTTQGATLTMSKGVISTDVEAAIVKFKAALGDTVLDKILNVNGIGQVDIP